MSEQNPDQAEEANAEKLDDAIPSRGYPMPPVVGLGGSAGSISALQAFFRAVPHDPGVAFVVVIHLSADFESNLAGMLQRSTRMPVVQVQGSIGLELNHVYVIPPGKSLRASEGYLHLGEPQTDRGRHVAVDLFFRTLADTHGPHSAAIVLSGADGDGAIGIKRIKERGGLTIAQDPEDAEHGGMPRSAIATGMVDWVLPVSDMPQRLLSYLRLESTLRLPSEEVPPSADSPHASSSNDEAALRDVLTFLRTRTGRDFSYYKRATILRRVGRRMQVNGINDLQGYLGCLRTRPGESGALLQDLLISVTNFFRDPDCFSALEQQVPALFANKGPNDTVRVWVAACATGEEAYSLAMMLSEQARLMETAPLIQIFATDLDEDAIRAAREGIYPNAIEADVSEDRLRRFFVKEHRGYRVRRELREMVLFAMHDVLKDSPFSRLDLVTCRNLLIYLNREAQARAFDIFHFALLPTGRLFLGSSESVEDGSQLFSVLDKKNRIYMQRPTPRAGLPVPSGPGTLALALEAQRTANEGPVLAGNAFEHGSFENHRLTRPIEGRQTSWSEVHLRLLEQLGPPSILVDSEYDIVHLSSSAGRFLQYSGGEPSRNLLRSVNPSLRIELRAALYHASQSKARTDVVGIPVELGNESLTISVHITPFNEIGADMYLVALQAHAAERGEALPDGSATRAEPDPVARHLDRELERLKSHLRDTVEQYEASTEELKASNEELQAMNEELRSATEELETSREELQSINEELTTVNHELKSKVDELGHANSDMHNLMDATAIATIFLDRELRITRYTPSAVTLFNLIPTDVGRPLTDLTSHLRYPELGLDARRVLERLVPIEREVGQSDGSWHLARLLPYRTIEDRIAGVVLSFVNITERKQAEEVRLWLSAVVTSSSDAIISFSLDRIILSWNGGAERIFGYSADEAIGRPLSMLAPPGANDADLRVMESASSEELGSIETVRRRKDGKDIHVSLTISSIRDDSGKIMAGTTTLRDISAAKQAEEALRESREQLRLVIENAREFAIFSTDLDRRVTIWNAGAQRLLGYTEEEVLGQSADIIFLPEDRADGAPLREAQLALHEGKAGDDRFHLRKDGTRFWASGATMLMRDASGQAVGFVKILRDQTAAREAQESVARSEAELRQALADAESARQQLELADESKDRFLAILSHELRNPLASIASSAMVMSSADTKDTLDSDRSRAVDVIARQSSAMSVLLDDLLDVSRLRLGRLAFDKRATSISAMIQTAVEAAGPSIKAAGHQLQIHLPAHDLEVHGDPQRLAQVAINLLTNAAKYTPKGGHISITAELQDGQVITTVADDGIGMEPGGIEQMFDMFTQATQVGASSTGGLGIGLALARSILESHNGWIEAHSEGLGRGSRVRFGLPLLRANPGYNATAAAPKSGMLPPTAIPQSILVVDDNPDAAWGIAKLLEIAGYRVLVADSAQRGLEMAEQHRPSIALLDIGMPDMDGRALAQRIRVSEWGRHTLLVATTGWGQESDVRRSLEAGFDAHLVKPVSIPQLRQLIDDHAARREA